MLDRTVTTVIESELCTGCGLCIQVCPRETIALQDQKACVVGLESLNCGHCAAACPTGAVRVNGIDPAMAEFQTFKTDGKWLPHGRYDLAQLVLLMQSRRSCRNFSNKPVDKGILEDLVKIGITAPSGSNCQPWRFTLLPDRQAVNILGRKTADFYQRLNRLAEKAWLRALMNLLGKPKLERYYQNYYQRVKEGLAEYDAGGRDMLFHGAPAAIIVSAQNDASCPAEDALLATQNILLAAHAMGLGTCLIGFVIEAMKREPAMGRQIGLDEDEKPYAAIALGYPEEIFQRAAGRKATVIRYFNG